MSDTSTPGCKRPCDEEAGSDSGESDAKRPKLSKDDGADNQKTKEVLSGDASDIAKTDAAPTSGDDKANNFKSKETEEAAPIESSTSEIRDKEPENPKNVADSESKVEEEQSSETDGKKSEAAADDKDRGNEKNVEKEAVEEKSEKDSPMEEDTKNQDEETKKTEAVNEKESMDSAPIKTEPEQDTSSIIEDKKNLDIGEDNTSNNIKDNCVKDNVQKEDEDNVKKENEDGEKEELNKEVEKEAADSVEQETSKSEGSEKENVVDKPESPDCIMLSDDEVEVRKAKAEKSVVHRSRILKKIRALQNQLRNEEATLVLLKKLRQSQMTPVQESAPQQMPPAKAPGHHPQQSPLIRQHGGPPPLVKGNQLPTKMTHSMNQHTHPRAQPGMNQGRSHPQTGGPPPPPLTPSRMGNGPNNHQQHLHSSRAAVHQNIARVNAGNSRSQQQHPQQQQHQAPPVPQKPVIPPQHPPQDTQTPAQRQAAAKQALRKQLEKTLLQIPPPKPPPPEMNFIPSLACPDFILLLGLEEVVNHMIDFQLIARGQKNPDERFVCTPFTCVQCGSDFTPVWKREKPGSKNVICEHCVTTNQKKALKQEHTNRLKSAFVKALQQEQEIERMQTSSTPVPSPQPSSSNNSSQSLNLSNSTPILPSPSAAAAAANAAAVAAVANFRPSAEQIRQHQNFLHQAQQAQLRGQPLGLQAFSHRAPFPYQLPFAKQQDLQRKYLLDMIPRGSMPWKQ